MSEAGKRDYSFDNTKYSEILTRQVVHMDQGVAYNPEYLATREMSAYPSRVAQVIRALYKGELPATEHGAEIAFLSILSAQGERWQSFGEDASDFMHCAILGRELFAKKGFPCVKDASSLDIKADSEQEALWQKAINLDENGACQLFVDDASYAYMGKAALSLGDFLLSKAPAIKGFSHGSTGFALLAHGLVDEGLARLQALVGELNSSGAKVVLSTSGAATFALTTLADAFGIKRKFELDDILTLAGRMDTSKAYIYMGSFYGRYLGASDCIKGLTQNTWEWKVANTPEFMPLYDGDKRVNGLTVWEAPLTAEYKNLHTPAKVQDAIFEAGRAEIERSACENLVVCEPFAWKKLNETGAFKGKLKYFWEVLT